MAASDAELPSGLRNNARLSRHLAHEIAVAGVGRDVEVALAVLGLDPGLDRDDLALGRLGERPGDGATLGEQLEILLRGMDQRALARLGLVDRLLRTDPDRESVDSDPSCSAT